MSKRRASDWTEILQRQSYPGKSCRTPIQESVARIVHDVLHATDVGRWSVPHVSSAVQVNARCTDGSVASRVFDALHGENSVRPEVENEIQTWLAQVQLA